MHQIINVCKVILDPAHYLKFTSSHFWTRLKTAPQEYDELTVHTKDHCKLKHAPSRFWCVPHTHAHSLILPVGTHVTHLQTSFLTHHYQGVSCQNNVCNLCICSPAEFHISRLRIAKSLLRFAWVSPVCVCGRPSDFHLHHVHIYVSPSEMILQIQILNFLKGRSMLSLLPWPPSTTAPPMKPDSRRNSFLVDHLGIPTVLPLWINEEKNRICIFSIIPDGESNSDQQTSREFTLLQCTGFVRVWTRMTVP